MALNIFFLKVLVIIMAPMVTKLISGYEVNLSIIYFIGLV